MKKAPGKVKREVVEISDDESTSAQPAEKIVKKEEESTPPHQHEASNCLQMSKWQMEIIALTEELDKSRRIADAANHRVEELTRENFALFVQIDLMKRTAPSPALPSPLFPLGPPPFLSPFQSSNLGTSFNPSALSMLPRPPPPTIPSMDVIEMQQQVVTWSQKYLEVKKSAREAEMRAVNAEKNMGFKLDFAAEVNKRIIEKLENRLAEVSMQLEEARNELKEVDNWKNREAELNIEIFAIKEELEIMKKRAEESTNKNMELTNEVFEIKEELEIMKRKVEESTNENIDLMTENYELKTNLREQLEEVRSGALEERTKLRERIDDLTRALAKYEGSQQQSWRPVQQLQQPQLQSPMRQRSAKDPRSADYLFPVADPINIFQLCSPDSLDVIPLDDVIRQLYAKLSECGEEKWRKYYKDGGRKVILMCGVCREKHSESILDHFFTESHIDKVRARGAAVSLPALQHWMRELQLAADSIYARPVQQVTAAAPPYGNI